MSNQMVATNTPLIDYDANFPYTKRALLTSPYRPEPFGCLITKDIDATYSFAQCMHLTGYEEGWLRKLVYAGRFPAPAFYCIGREGRYAKNDVDAWVADRNERKQAA